VRNCKYQTRQGNPSQKLSKVCLLGIEEGGQALPDNTENVICSQSVAAASTSSVLLAGGPTLLAALARKQSATCD